MLRTIKLLFVLAFATIFSGLVAMDLGYEVATDLALVCTKALLEKHSGHIGHIKVDTPVISDTVIERISCNYCAIAIVDYDAQNVFF
jgi:hypothetical protein